MYEMHAMLCACVAHLRARGLFCPRKVVKSQNEFGCGENVDVESMMAVTGRTTEILSSKRIFITIP